MLPGWIACTPTDYPATMTGKPVSLTKSGPPEVIMDGEPAEALSALAEASATTNPVASVSTVCLRWPACLDAWASLGEALTIQSEHALAYAAFRTGYHRGLDRLRANGWRGSGLVRWRHPTNRGFLRSLQGLGDTAAEIGESDEAQRCSMFLRQLDPDWPPTDTDS